MHNVIITGADGFVGSETAKYFLSRGCDVIAVGRKASPERLQPSENLKYISCDVSNIDQMRELLKSASSDSYDAYIHFAWNGSAGNARTDYELQLKNVRDTVENLKFAKSIGCKKFVCAGSIMEYEVEAVVHSQGSLPGMAYIYGMCKLMAHCICKSVAANIGIDLLWPMITNAYGPGEMSPRFLNTTLRKIMNNEPLQFTSAVQNYDFVYITDAARAFYLITENGKPFHEYIIGSSQAKPLREFIIEIKDTLAPEADLLFGDVPFTGTNMPLETFDTSKTEHDCGFKAQVKFSDGVKNTYDWLRNLHKGGDRSLKIKPSSEFISGGLAA